MPNDGIGPRLSAKLRAIAALLFVLYALVAGFAPVMDNVDLGWHVAQGRWMVEHHAFYSHDAFNYPNLGHAVIDEYPLFQLVLYAAYSLGWAGPCLLTSALLAALILVLLHAARGADAFLQTRLLAALGMMLLLLHIGSILRPHLVSYLCLAALGTFLLRHREPRSLLEFWPAVLIQVAWTNSHSAFVIGPALVGLFGLEATLRQSFRSHTFPGQTAFLWLGGFLVVLAACLINPYGLARFQPPFVQEHMEAIRAYVGEMEPLPAASQKLFFGFLAFFAGWIVLSRPRWRGLSLAFLLLAAVFFHEALDARKAWPIFGVMLPLIVLSERAFIPPRERQPALGHLAANFVLASCIAAALVETARELPVQWRALAAGQSEMAHEAVAWMKANHIEGKLFHRDEDGGLLQMEGFTQTFSDTGFGKFDEDFIHETGLVSERPKLLPHYLAAYQPDYVVCGNWCYQWPYYLKQAGWRLIFYSPNSSVWTRPDTRPDLPTVTDDAITAAFARDHAENGVPSDIALYGRNLIALNSLGLGDFANAQLRDAYTRETFAWTWEAARILCFGEPPLSSTHRDEWMHLAQDLDGPVRQQFYACGLHEEGQNDRAFSILSSIPPKRLNDASATTLLKLQLDRNDPDALTLARRTDIFDLRNGRHWQYLAEAEQRWGSLDTARLAWKKAVFYYPDDPDLLRAATDFATDHDDPSLNEQIANSTKIYGAR